MSTTTSSSARLTSVRDHLSSPTNNTMSGPGPHPRWKQLIQNSINTHIKDEKSILYHALSTLSPAGSSSSSSSSAANSPVPHVRYVVHRGFLNENRSSKTPTGTAPAQSSFTTGTSLLTTSDVRAPKVAELDKSGGWAEIAWWHDSAQLQFRISGQIHVLPRPGHPLADKFPRDRLAPARQSGNNGDDPFDWEAERLRIFYKMSPNLLASFARPVPGSEHPNAAKLGDEQGGPGEDDKPAKDDLQSPWPQELPQPQKLDGGEEDLTDEQKKTLEVSKSNFALLVMEPQRIDVVDLARDKRSLFERVTPSSSANSGAQEEWKETRLVP
ncbi:hypothetical protein CF326_g4524 [Tilletia indica]|nr:hypothetical protein CF326_g4524 [Tilletia indica]